MELMPALLVLCLLQDARALIDKLDDEDAQVRQKAKAGLVAMGLAAVEALKQANKSEEVRETMDRIFEAELARVENLVRNMFDARPRQGDPWQGVHLGELLHLQKDLSPASRTKLLECVRLLRSQWKTPDFPRVRELVQDQLAGGDRLLAVQVAKEFGLREEAPRIRPLLQVAKIDRRIVMQTLAAFNDQESVEALLELLRQNDWQLRRSAAEALGTLRAKAAVEPLIGLLDDPGMETNYVDSAILALGQIGDAKAVAPVRKFLDHNPHREYMKKTALTALADLGDPDLPRDLIQAFREKPEREDLLQTLIDLSARLNVRDAGPEILKVFNDRCLPDLEKNSIIASCAIQALVRLQSPDAVPVLLQYLRRCPQRELNRMLNHSCHTAATALFALATTEDIPELRRLAEQVGEKIEPNVWDSRNDHAYATYQKLLCASAALGDRESIPRIFSWLDRCKGGSYHYFFRLLFYVNCDTGLLSRLRKAKPAREVIEGLSKDLGVSIEVEDDAKLPERLCVDPTRFDSVDPDLAVAMLIYSLGGQTAAVLESGKIRLVPMDRALQSRRAWAKQEGLLKQ
jgi:HEAT repeat protein